jgi:hypothetical protein
MSAVRDGDTNRNQESGDASQETDVRPFEVSPSRAYTREAFDRCRSGPDARVLMLYLPKCLMPPSASAFGRPLSGQGHGEWLDQSKTLVAIQLLLMAQVSEREHVPSSTDPDCPCVSLWCQVWCALPWVSLLPACSLGHVSAAMVQPRQTRRPRLLLLLLRTRTQRRHHEETRLPDP